MKRKKVAIIGHFGADKNFLDGQTIKTKVLYKELSDKGVYVKKVDTYYRSHNVIKLICDLFIAIITCKHIIILVAENGMKKMFPILYFCSKFLRKKIYHAVIGASLAQRVMTYKNFKKYLNSFCANWCETKGLVKKLQQLGVSNAELLYNCKRLNPVSENALVKNEGEPYRLCMFSRVMKEKGIEDGVIAVKSINEKCGRVVYILDIYGQVDSKQKEWFEKVQREFPPYIRYCGVIPYDESVDVLKNYFALLFPTRYWTEGVPGTIIDAYAAGLPVIASKWENFDNIIDETTGIGYEFNNVDDLIDVLDYIKANPDYIEERKKDCIEKYKQFSPEVIIDQILKKMEIRVKPL